MKVKLKLIKGQSLTSPTGLRVFKGKEVETDNSVEIAYFTNHPDVNVTVIREKGRPPKAMKEALNGGAETEPVGNDEPDEEEAPKKKKLVKKAVVKKKSSKRKKAGAGKG